MKSETYVEEGKWLTIDRADKTSAVVREATADEIKRAKAEKRALAEKLLEEAK